MENNRGDWEVMYYNDRGDFISMHTIKNRTEHEAEREAVADMPYECDDWSLYSLKP